MVRYHKMDTAAKVAWRFNRERRAGWTCTARESGRSPPWAIWVGETVSVVGTLVTAGAVSKQVTMLRI